MCIWYRTLVFGSWGRVFKVLIGSWGVNLEFFFLKRPALGCFPGLFWFKVWPRKLRRGLYDPKIFADLSGQYVDLIVSHLILFKLKIK